MSDADVPRRVAMLSVHTSPLDQPGTGDAGGMNVYVVETARRLARRGTEVEIFTRATSSGLPTITELAPGVLVRHVVAGPFERLAKDDLPGQLCAVTAGMMRVEARRDPGWYDLVHSNYWISGQAGCFVANRWQVPLVHTMHTMAKVKNASIADGDAPEPAIRVTGEEQIVATADRLLANTEKEAAELVDLYDAPPDRVAVVPPGVDLDVFSPGGPEARRAARRRLGLPGTGRLLLFVGRIQPLKAPDVLIRAVGEILREDPDRRDELLVAVVGGPSGTGLDRPEELTSLTASLGLDEVVRFHPPARRSVLADWYRAADLVVVPSHNESFGLVALEAQACGTPVVAARVGGLVTAVSDGRTGVLVDGHDPVRWAGAIRDLLDDCPRRCAMQAAAVRHATAFGWDRTVDTLSEVYAEAMGQFTASPRFTGAGGVAGAGDRPRTASPVSFGALAVAP
ncbi:MAG: D-inositol-3-phosphate glycosyltransferase [Actinomycetota bacterium]|nr:D-inositol-3-phosphate glycosyltransferase [Actinomycetota bacterium]